MRTENPGPRLAPLLTFFSDDANIRKRWSTYGRVDSIRKSVKLVGYKGDLGSTVDMALRPWAQQFSILSNGRSANNLRDLFSVGDMQVLVDASCDNVGRNHHRIDALVTTTKRAAARDLVTSELDSVLVTVYGLRTVDLVNNVLVIGDSEYFKAITITVNYYVT